MNLNTLRALLPYLRYLPAIILLVQATTDAVEASALPGSTSAQKEAAAVEAIQKSLLALGGVTLDTEVIKFLITTAVTVGNALGRYIKKA